METNIETLNTVAQSIGEKAKLAHKAPLKSLSPSVFSYLDFRDYLNDWFKWKKIQQPGFSCTVFAKKTGMKSHAYIGMVTKGKRNLTHKSLRAFAKALALNAGEYNYFEKLVLFNQASTAADKNFYFEQLRHAELANRGNRQIVEKLQNASALLRHWYVVAIFEMVTLTDFRADPDWMTRALKNRITPTQAKDAWKSLLEAGLVSQDATGRWHKHTQLLDFDPERLDFVIQNFHTEMLQRAAYAVQNEVLAERELSSLTLPICPEDIPLLKKELKEFRKKINREYSREDNTGKQIVCINMQLLNLTTQSQGG